MATDLDSLVRNVDEDRWLASRFAPPDARERLIALYAVNYEIARTAEVVREPALGEIRLAWWRDALQQTAQGAPPGDHPALRALAARFPAAAAPLAAMTEARRSDFSPAPFAAWSDLERYVDATAGELMRQAMRACGPEVSEEELAAAKPAAQAWGGLGLVRAAPVWEARGRSLYPAEGGGRAELLARAARAYAALRSCATPSSAVFPAIGYVALAPAYLRAMRAAAGEPALLLRQLRLIAAAATGRL